MTPPKPPAARTGRRIEGAARRYEDACGTAHGLDLIGDRWALLVVRELMLGPWRFSGTPRQLAAVLHGMLPWRAVKQAGEVLIEGDQPLARKLISLFPLPEKFDPASTPRG